MFKNGFSTLNKYNKRNWLVGVKSRANLGLLPIPIRDVFIVFVILYVSKDRLEN